MIRQEDKISQLLTRRVEKIYPSRQALKSFLLTGKRLRLYLGIDPTATRLHLGHTIALHKLQEFADIGHEAILLFGTGTVLVGDPSQRARARKLITQKEIKKNITTWKQQASKIINFDKVKIKKNGDWLLKLTLTDIIKIASHVSAVQLFKREMFERRINSGDTVWYHETLYPLLQGYDSVAMDVDLEIGGTDQTFNMLIGRQLMQKMKHKEKFVLTVPMILGIDGAPMSKTSNNCIWLTDSVNDMFGKIMSIPDSLLESYLELLTDLKFNRLSLKKDPLSWKRKLAFEIVKVHHGKISADKAKKYFEIVVQKKSRPENIPVVTINLTGKKSVDIVSFLVATKLCFSRSQAKRLINQGAISVENKLITDYKSKIIIKNGVVIKAGKRKYAKLKLEN